MIRSVRDFPGRGRAVGFAVAGTVIMDGDDVVVVATAPGSSVRTRAGSGEGPNGRIVPHDRWDGSYQERTWEGDLVVRVHRWGEPWSVWRWHDGRAWTDRWYGNLETPWRRTAVGYDAQDWALDVVAEGQPSSETWLPEFKDADELQWMVERGLVAAEEGEFVRSVGARLMGVARDGGWPFTADWDAWLPDKDWGAVRLPEAWQTPGP